MVFHRSEANPHRKCSCVGPSLPVLQATGEHATRRSADQEASADPSNSNSGASHRDQDEVGLDILKMLSRTVAKKVLPRTVQRAFSSEASETTSVTLNFSVPYESIYNGASVFQVIIPGVEGEYGVTPHHVPYVAQLKPGVLQILHEEGNIAESEKYFVAGGYALTHANSVTDVVCPEAVKLDDIDPSSVQSQFDAAKSAFASSTAGSVEQAEAQIDMEVNRAMGLAIGINLA
jgi:F-type H+-transporting ATPase subunit delta